MVHVPSANRTMTLGNMRTHTPKPLRVFVQQEGARFRVVYQRQYPQTVEEAIYSERFKTPEEAQKFIDTALRAQRIYRNLQDGVLGN
jgi:hypothetical protein